VQVKALRAELALSLDAELFSPSIGVTAFRQRLLIATKLTVNSTQIPSLTRRMACWMYEGMLMFGVVFIAGYLFGTLSQTRNAMDNRHALQAFVFVIFGIYFVWFWAKGQTLAMKTWNIRVVDVHGAAVTQKRALLRYVLSWLWFLPPLGVSWLFALPGMDGAVLTLGWVAVWAILARFHPRQQFWHDAWAGTQLVTWMAPAKTRKKTSKAENSAVAPHRS
jgi:uncharacterized RDD family membrane protein YckC